MNEIKYGIQCSGIREHSNLKPYARVLIIIRPTGVSKIDNKCLHIRFGNVWRTYVRLGPIMIKTLSECRRQTLNPRFRIWVWNSSVHIRLGQLVSSLFEESQTPFWYMCM